MKLKLVCTEHNMDLSHRDDDFEVDGKTYVDLGAVRNTGTGEMEINVEVVSDEFYCPQGQRKCALKWEYQIVQ